MTALQLSPRHSWVRGRSDQLEAEAIAASRSDSRPDVAAETVFAELFAFVDEIEAEQSST